MTLPEIDRLRAYGVPVIAWLGAVEVWRRRRSPATMSAGAPLDAVRMNTFLHGFHAIIEIDRPVVVYTAHVTASRLGRIITNGRRRPAADSVYERRSNPIDECAAPWTPVRPSSIDEVTDMPRTHRDRVGTPGRDVFRIVEGTLRVGSLVYAGRSTLESGHAPDSGLDHVGTTQFIMVSGSAVIRLNRLHHAGALRSEMLNGLLIF